VGSLEGRITVITGAGRGLGRAHALLFAAEGAKVVVNDLGSDPDGGGDCPDAADAVVEEIRAAGGEAVANHDDVATWAGGQALIEAAIDTFGGLDVLVNNAGILRDRALVHMTEEEWDTVTTVHLKGHFVPTRFAAAYWREQTKAGTPRAASIIHTSSTSGLLGNPGQTNYGTAKAGVAAFSSICAQELARYGVRSNCIVPAARTRLTEAAPGLSDIVAAPGDGAQFDLWDPAHVSPVVGYLGTRECSLNGRTLFVQGGTIRMMDGWQFGASFEQDERWSIEQLRETLHRLT
jgi:NAD(P)-dependent dehydrogenase (short-subunit alcohol dehydrogenase family)